MCTKRLAADEIGPRSRMPLASGAARRKPREARRPVTRIAAIAAGRLSIRARTTRHGSSARSCRSSTVSRSRNSRTRRACRSRPALASAEARKRLIRGIGRLRPSWGIARRIKTIHHVCDISAKPAVLCAALTTQGRAGVVLERHFAQGCYQVSDLVTIC
jgi:hypothetical protein